MLLRGKTPIRIGINSRRTHTSAVREHSACLHAEMDALIAAKPGDTLVVFRWTKRSAEPTMAKPCTHCEARIKQAKIKKVFFTNWQGEMERWRE